LCGGEGRYATTVDEAARHLGSLTDRAVAEREGQLAAQRVRQQLRAGSQWTTIERAFLSEIGMPAGVDWR
jgi:hypothetical protein